VVTAVSVGALTEDNTKFLKDLDWKGRSRRPAESVREQWRAMVSALSFVSIPSLWHAKCIHQAAPTWTANKGEGT
jgi:hypothetical protein